MPSKIISHNHHCISWAIQQTYSICFIRETAAFIVICMRWWIKVLPCWIDPWESKSLMMSSCNIRTRRLSAARLYSTCSFWVWGTVGFKTTCEVIQFQYLQYPCYLKALIAALFQVFMLHTGGHINSLSLPEEQKVLKEKMGCSYLVSMLIPVAIATAHRFLNVLNWNIGWILQIAPLC